MTTPRSVIYGISTLSIAIIIIAGSFALTDYTLSDNGASISSTSPTTTRPVVVVQPPIDIGPLAESITGTGLSIVFDEDDEPDVTGEDALGLTLTSKQRTVVNFIADIGDRVEVKLNIDNLNEETETLALVNVVATESLLIDVIEDSGTDEVRLVGDNLYIMEVARGEGHSFKLHVTPVKDGVHVFIVEIRALG